MTRVNIYTYTTIKGPRKQAGAFAYILEMETDKDPATLSKIQMLPKVTQNQAELTVLAAALQRIKKPCVLSIYTDCKHVAAAFEKNWIDSWKENGWINARGKPVGNREEWQKAAELLGRYLMIWDGAGKEKGGNSILESLLKKMEERQ